MRISEACDEKSKAWPTGTVELAARYFAYCTIFQFAMPSGIRDPGGARAETGPSAKPEMYLYDLKP
jgi:hypothetical protein